MQPVEIMIEEYKTLRDEVSKALGYRLQITSFGLATIGVLIGSSSVATINKYSTISGLILSIAIPAVCCLTAHIWLSEAHRARRASWYIWGLETRINKLSGQVLLQWESGLRNGHKSLALFRSHYYWTIGFFTLSASVSVAIGLKQMGQNSIVSMLVAVIVLLILAFPTSYRLIKFKDYDVESEIWTNIA